MKVETRSRKKEAGRSQQEAGSRKQDRDRWEEE